MTASLVVEKLCKEFGTSAERVAAVCDVSLDAQAGELFTLLGPSGCGKSALLRILGGMDRPTRGEVWLRDLPLHTYDEEALTRVRRTQVGFVFQFFYLLPTFTVEENVGLPLLLAGVNHAGPKIARLLERVGLAHRLKALPHQLSGGEMQRVAIARAVIHEPPLILADEPTGNLDSENGAHILNLLSGISTGSGTTVVMATHSETAAQWATRIIRMKDGRVV